MSKFKINFIGSLGCLILLTILITPSSAQSTEQININTASIEELMRLPYVGNTVAHRIFEYRQKHGPFKRPQDIVIIKGLSAKRYRQISSLIRI